MNFSRKIAVFAICLFIPAHPLFSEVILHAFDWPYKEITKQAAEIKKSGCAAVLVAPALKTITTTEWWGRYQPVDYRVLDNPLGNKTDFAEMVDALSPVKVYADIVFNQMSSESQFSTTLDYPGTAVLADYSARSAFFEGRKLFGDLTKNLFSSADFRLPKRTIASDEYESPYPAQHYWLSDLPDLGESAHTIQQQRDYLRALIGLGVQGFRIDAAKHMTLTQIDSIFIPAITTNCKVFGEIIVAGGCGDQAYDSILKPFISNTPFEAYDFPLLSTIHPKFIYGGDLTGLLDTGKCFSLQPGRSVQFVVTHDIPNNGTTFINSLFTDTTDESLAQAFLLGRGGGDFLLYCDFLLRTYSFGSSARWMNTFAKDIVQKEIAFNNACANKACYAMYQSPLCLIGERGDKGLFCVNKSAQTITITIPANNIKMSLKNSPQEILGSKATVSSANDSVKFAMPARSAGMWLDSASSRVKDFKPKHREIPVYEAIALHFNARTNCLQISQHQSVHSRISISLYNPSGQCIFHAGTIPFNQGTATIRLNAVKPGICFAVANSGPLLASLKFVR